jgi:hypothetical protein
LENLKSEGFTFSTEDAKGVFEIRPLAIVFDHEAGDYDEKPPIERAR